MISNGLETSMGLRVHEATNMSKYKQSEFSRQGDNIRMEIIEGKQSTTKTRTAAIKRAAGKNSFSITRTDLHQVGNVLHRPHADFFDCTLVTTCNRICIITHQ